MITIDEQIHYQKQTVALAESRGFDAAPEQAILSSLKELKRIREVQVPEEVDVGEMIFVWSMRPKPDTATGAAWEQGARQGWAWRQEHIDTLRDLLKRESARAYKWEAEADKQFQYAGRVLEQANAAEAKLAQIEKMGREPSDAMRDAGNEVILNRSDRKQLIGKEAI
jgi:hypothetical protein